MIFGKDSSSSSSSSDEEENKNNNSVSLGSNSMKEIAGSYAIIPNRKSPLPAQPLFQKIREIKFSNKAYSTWINSFKKQQISKESQTKVCRIFGNQICIAFNRSGWNWICRNISRVYLIWLRLIRKFSCLKLCQFFVFCKLRLIT